MRFGAALLQFVEEHALGLVAGAETGFLVSSPEEPDTVLAPDLAFIAADRLPVPDAREWKVFPRLPPDLVVEVASPSQRRPALSAKANQWLDAGVSLVWVIWPTTRQVDVWHAGPEVEVKTLSGSEVLRGEPVLPGFAFPMSRLWR
jgi:Uma2 family endonuclease